MPESSSQSGNPGTCTWNWDPNANGGEGDWVIHTDNCGSMTAKKPAPGTPHGDNVPGTCEGSAGHEGGI